MTDAIPAAEEMPGSGPNYIVQFTAYNEQYPIRVLLDAGRPHPPAGSLENRRWCS
jgi:hypothetical protein